MKLSYAGSWLPLFRVHDAWTQDSQNLQALLIQEQGIQFIRFLHPLEAQSIAQVPTQHISNARSLDPTAPRVVFPSGHHRTQTVHLDHCSSPNRVVARPSTSHIPHPSPELLLFDRATELMNSPISIYSTICQLSLYRPQVRMKGAIMIQPGTGQFTVST